MIEALVLVLAISLTIVIGLCVWASIQLRRNPGDDWRWEPPHIPEPPVDDWRRAIEHQDQTSTQTRYEAYRRGLHTRWNFPGRCP